MRQPAEKGSTKSRRAVAVAMAQGHNERNRAQGLAELASEPDRPEVVEYLWQWLMELDAGRGSGNGFGPASLSYNTIEVWARMSGRRPTFVEVQALLLLDAVLCSDGADPDTDSQ